MKYNIIYIDSEIGGIGNLGIGSGVNVPLGEMVVKYNRIYIDSGQPRYWQWSQCTVRRDG